MRRFAGIQLVEGAIPEDTAILRFRHLLEQQMLGCRYMTRVTLSKNEHTAMTNLTATKAHEQEVGGGERFAFGKNWARFLKVLDEQRIQQAVDSLKTNLGVDNLKGKSFLDIGSGSGLFSLTAKRLGAKVLSF